MRISLVCRTLLVAVVVVPVSLTCGEQSGSAERAQQRITRHECRVEWRDLVSLHGENGNPGGPVPELTARWDGFYAGGVQYVQTATRRDCGAVIEGYAADWDTLETVQYDLYAYDPLGKLAGAEGNRDHALSFQHLHHLSPELERAFRVARRQAPAAAADLAPALAEVPGTDLDDPGAVAAVLADLDAAADASRHLRKLERALRIIGNAELDEE